jgi:hypothetical protein
MKSKLLSLVSLAAVGIGTLGAISGAQAATVFTQPLSTALSGFASSTSSSGSQQLADPFSITGGGTINQVTWYGYNRVTSGPFGTFSVFFYANSTVTPGTPGASLFSVTGVTPTQTDTGQNQNGAEIFQFSFDLSPGLVVPTGTTEFFSVLEASPTSAPFNFVWSFSAQTAGAVATTNGGTTWLPLSENQAFTLSNVPVSNVPLPAALPLFATGLAGLGLLGRRRKRKDIAA